MEIYSFDTLPSTQRYLLQQIESAKLAAPVAVIAKEQSSGIGSRESAWFGGEGNFFASFALELEQLPEDLPLGSASIYFAYLMVELLRSKEERVWLKWPNDLYKGDEKVGGIITQKINNSLVCGIGINLKNDTNGFKGLHSDISADSLLKSYLEEVEKFPKWKEIFSEYQIEFEQSRRFSVHIENYEKSLQDALLCEDGSLLIEGKRVFSSR